MRVVLIVGLLTVVATGCRFPDTCDLYPGPDPQGAATTASWAPRTSCSLSVRYLGRTYAPKSNAIVTDLGDPIDGVTLRTCNDDQSTGDRSRPVVAFAFGTYCTTDVIAVELNEGDQLMLFQSENSRNATTSVLTIDAAPSPNGGRRR